MGALMVRQEETDDMQKEKYTTCIGIKIIVNQEWPGIINELLK